MYTIVHYKEKVSKLGSYTIIRGVYLSFGSDVLGRINVTM